MSNEMSTIIHSEDDESSSTSSLSQSAEITGRPIEPQVPLAASLVLGRLSPDKKHKIEQIVEGNVEKITIRFQPIGSTPAIVPNNFKISSTQSVSTLIKFMTKKLRFKSGIIYLYIQNSFQPTPDEKIGDLYNLYKTNNELIVSYCHSVAFG